jgi:Exostosin family
MKVLFNNSLSKGCLFLLLGASAFAKVPLEILHVYEKDRSFQWYWMEALSEEFDCIHKHDPDLSNIQDGSVVVLLHGSLNQAQLEACQKAKNHNKRFILIHQSDEAYENDHIMYEYPTYVFREYYHKDITDNKRIFNIPLTVKNGFTCDRSWNELPDIYNRPYLWSFIGQVKSNRVDMLYSLKRLTAPHFTYFNSSFNGNDCLSTQQYEEVMLKTIFAPCPMGWCNQDSFRVYEALEAGCIPIVEKGKDNYFNEAYNNPPLIIMDDWKNVCFSIADLMKDPFKLELKRKECFDFWVGQKKKVKQLLKQKIEEIQKPI